MKLIIEAIEAKLQQQKDEIDFKTWQIADLKHKVEELEKELEKAKAEGDDF